MITLQARETLADCAVAIEDFETSAATKYWRTRWVAVVTLLRSVGYVLEKVDAPSDPTVGAAISAEFQDLKRSKPEPHIYWEFIDKERHSVVKEMEFGAHLNITVRPGTAWWNPKTGETGGVSLQVRRPTTISWWVASSKAETRGNCVTKRWHSGTII